MTLYRTRTSMLHAAFGVGAWSVIVAAILGIGMAWGWWIGMSDCRVERDMARLEKEVARQQARLICDEGPAWMNVDDGRILCAGGSMRNPLLPPMKARE